MRYTSVSNRRSGMVLLIVMVLLSMVGLTAVTFLLTSGQFREAANQNLRFGEYMVDPEALLQDGIMTVIRGTENEDSATNINSETGCSLLEDMYGTGSYGKPDKFSGSFGNNTDGMVVINGGKQEYAGRVITCITPTSRAYRRSTVVLKYQNSKLYCLPFDDNASFSGESVTFLVNSLPFQQSKHDYDAYDKENPYLAKRIDGPGYARVIHEEFRSFHIPDPRGVIPPKIRPTKTGCENQIPMGGKALLVPVEGPDTTDPYYYLTLDADNDGYDDSYWLDLGMPTYVNKNGKRFKPMYGVVIEDMDGKININAAGNWPFENNKTSVEYGMGRGPAEIFWSRTFESIMPPGDSQNDKTKRASFLAQDLYKGRMMTQFPTNLRTVSSSEYKPDHHPDHSVRGLWYKTFNKDTTVNGGVGSLRRPHDLFGRIKYEISADSGEPVYDYQSFYKDVSQHINADIDMGSDNGNTYDRDLGLNHNKGLRDESITSMSNRYDMPYSVAEWETLRRPYDFDSPFLPKRLRYLVERSVEQKDGSSGISSLTEEDVQKILRQFKYLITTESWDLPIAKKISTSHLSSCVPEIAAGWKIDLLRAASFNFTEDAWDNSKNCYPKRQQFMQSIYEILKDQEFDPGGSGYDIVPEMGVKVRQAQWAANVVDFLDTDNVMTPFKPLGESFTVFGCEQPELLISETCAMHSRNTEPDALCKIETGNGTEIIDVGGKEYDENGNALLGPLSDTDTVIYGNYKEDFQKEDYPVLEKDGSIAVHPTTGESPYYLKDSAVAKITDKLSALSSHTQGDASPDEEADWDQYLRPQGAVFVQIHSPLSYAETPIVANDIYASGTREIDLAKVAKTNPVWRLAFTDYYNTSISSKLDSEYNLGRDTATWPQVNGMGDCFQYHIKLLVSFNQDEQYIVDPDMQSLNMNKVYFKFYPSENRRIGPGQFVLIGPKGQTVFKFNPEAESYDKDNLVAGKTAKSITLSGSTYTGNYGSGQAMAIEPLNPNNPQRYARFSLTEPRSNNHSDYYGIENLDFSFSSQNAELSLESPLDIPVDTSWGIFKYNNESDQEYESRMRDIMKNFNPNKYKQLPRCMVHLQRLADPTRAWNNDTNPYITVDSMLVDLTVKNARDRFEMAEYKFDEDEYKHKVVDTIFTQKRGTENTFIWEQLPNKQRTEPELSQQEPTFGHPLPGSKAWLGWLNTTPVSPLQLMNVTNRCSSELMYFYHGSGEGGSGLSNTYGYLPRYSGDLRKLMGYFRVATPQIVTPMVLNKYTRSANGNEQDDIPGGYYTMYREPGKINLNTATANVKRALVEYPNNSTFRSTIQAPDESLLSATGAGTNDCDPTNRFKYYRLANLTTPRSNVFAVWITMGFFEVDENNNFIFCETQDDGRKIRKPLELGEDTGDRKRYRAFYMIDRTIPVAFERGKNHNADKVIILRRMLQ